MEMNIKLDKNFTTQFNKLMDEYGTEMAKLNGFSEEQLSYTDFIDNFIDKQTVADASIDGNANVGTKDICSLTAEMSKPHSKLLAFNKIYHEMNKKYGFNTANEWLKNEWDGHFYLHDAASSTYVSYCFAYDIEELVKRGLYFIDNFNAQPPKHLETYTDFVGEFVSWTSNRTSGACGLPSFLVYSFYFWKKDCKDGFYIKSPEYYRDQEFQRIIYKLNQPYLRVNQSAFTNFSIFDREYLIALFGGKEFPDGTFIIDYIDDIIEYQKAFMNVVSKVRSQNMMTFPVLTYALLRKEGKFVDEDFAKWCCKMNMAWADSNFFISSDVTSLSNCCFDGSQKCLSKSSNGVNYMTFEELYNAQYIDTKRNFTIFHNGNWVKGKLIRLPGRSMYKIVTTNNKEMLLTDNHICLTESGEKPASDITESDYLLFNTKPLNSVHESDEELTYAQGYLIGMYLGDGSMNRESADVALSLNEYKYHTSLKYLQEAIGENVKIHLSTIQHNVYPVNIRDRDVALFIRRFVSGDYCFEKRLNADCILQSIDFRRGILDGYYMTDGGNSNKIYTTSKGLVDDIEMLCTSLGMQTIINISDRTGDGEVIIRGQAYNRNYPVYCIRWYETYKRHQKDIYKWKNNSIFFKVKSVEKIEEVPQYVYCFEMEDTEEPYFTLPNGIITHNCRLVSDVNKLGYFNSIGGTALEVGSVKVNTINLARISYESATTDEYIDVLRKKVVLDLQALDVVRGIIKRNIEKGLLPNYSHKIINMSSQYNSIGIIGVYETLQKYGMTYKDEFGNTYYTEEGVEFAKRILAVINEEKDKFTADKDYQANIEQIPGERAASILMQKDMFFYPNQAYELPLYGNQWVPLGVKTTLNEKIKLSAILDKACNGGSIAHINCDTNFTNFDTAWNLLNYIADAGVVYFAFCTRISACAKNHGFYGDKCPTCGGDKVTTYQRIVGLG